ncbi:hypothetical protein [Halalkalicoccus ordinarius]|uniref:hypothetical protein n=1 Tax=Halalkalicoccus ordinarius TaxID=3116651 RepID=UPI00300E80D8
MAAEIDSRNGDGSTRDVRGLPADEDGRPDLRPGQRALLTLCPTAVLDREPRVLLTLHPSKATVNPS